MYTRGLGKLAAIYLLFLVISAAVAFLLFKYLLSSEASAAGTIFGIYVKTGGPFAGFIITVLVLHLAYSNFAKIILPRKLEIKGNIVDEDNNPIPDATVQVDVVDRQKTTDCTGWFAIEVDQQSEWTVRAGKPSLFAYAAIKVAARDIGKPVRIRLKKSLAPPKLGELLAQYPLPLAGEVDPYDVLGVARTEHVDDYAARRERPPYISRTQPDGELDEALRKTNRFVVLTGRAKSGKSRTAFEAVKRNFPDYAMLVPARPFDPSRLPKLVQRFDEVANSYPKTVLWLDDMERFVDAGSLTVGLLSQIRQKHEVLVIVATIRSMEFDRLWSAEGEIGRNAQEVLNRAVRVHLGDFLAVDERETARQIYSQYPALDFNISVGEAFVAAQQLKARYDMGPESCPEGAAVVRAAIDCRRIGVVRPIPEVFLKELWQHYVQEIEPLKHVSDAAFGHGLEWAGQRLVRYTALLEKVGDPESGGGFSEPDYLVEHVEKQQKPIPEVVWDLARDRCQDLGSDLTAVGNVAWSRGLYDKAKILGKSLSLGDGAAAYNLARLHLYDGNVSDAKATLKRGIDLDDGPSAFGLGWLLAGEGDRSGAKAAYKRGMELGEGRAALNLGVLLEGDGDRGGAKAAYQAAVELGILEAQERL